MIALVDYGAGNVRSVHKALEAVGGDVRLACEPGSIRTAEKVVLPGVGAFADYCDSSPEHVMATTDYGGRSPRSWSGDRSTACSFIRRRASGWGWGSCGTSWSGSVGS